MKTFDERMKSIQKKGKRMKAIRLGIRSAVVTACLMAIIICGTVFGPDIVLLGRNFLAPLSDFFNGSTGTTDLQGPTDPTPPTPEMKYDGGEVTVRFFHAMSSSCEKLMDSYIEEFNKQYPNIHIETMNVNKLDTLLSSPQCNADMVLCMADYVDRYQNKWNNLVNMKNLMCSDGVAVRADGTTEPLGLTSAQAEAFYSICLDSCRLTRDGQLRAMPFYHMSDVVYYNKTFFEENGLAIPATWNEMWTTAQKIHSVQENYMPLNVIAPEKLLAILMRQNGVQIHNGVAFSYDDPAVEQFVVEFVNRYTAGDWDENKGYGLECNSYGNNSAMILDRCVGGDFFQSKHGEYEVGVASVPQVNAAHSQTWSETAGFCIMDQGDSQKIVAAWLFIKFLTTNPELQAAFSMKTGYLPAYQPAVELPVYQQWLASANGYDNITALAAKCALEQMDSWFTVQNIPDAYSSLEAVSQIFLCGSAESTDGDILELYRELCRDYVLADAPSVEAPHSLSAAPYAKSVTAERQRSGK